MHKIELANDRFFEPDLQQKQIAMTLYEQVKGLPLVCPHGHVPPNLFADEKCDLGTPTEFLVIPDHYVFRMLYSHGISMEALGIPPRPDSGIKVEQDFRKIWQVFAENFYLFRGTPTGIWLTLELVEVFGIQEKLDGASGQRIYDQIAEKLKAEDFRPRKLFDRFNIEVMCTTDGAADSLQDHAAIRNSAWRGRILPTFRPDAVVNLDSENWSANLAALSQASGIDINNYKSFIQALEKRRAYFKQHGATSTDSAALTAYSERLSPAAAESIFSKALSGNLTDAEIIRFNGHMLSEMARMSCEDGLVMQLHVGAFRNHNPLIFDRFGRDKGCDIPITSEFTQNLRPLLNQFGNNPNLTLVLFTLDETVYSRELAPLAGHYPAVKLGPPWWFHDSINGMKRYLDQVVETAGIYNTTGFIDDTRAFASIPARHDVWRRVAVNWLAGQVVRRMIDMQDASEMAYDLAYGLGKKTYKL